MKIRLKKKHTRSRILLFWDEFAQPSALMANRAPQNTPPTSINGEVLCRRTSLLRRTRLPPHMPRYHPSPLGNGHQWAPSRDAWLPPLPRCRSARRGQKPTGPAAPTVFASAGSPLLPRLFSSYCSHRTVRSRAARPSVNPQRVMTTHDS